MVVVSSSYRHLVVVRCLSVGDFEASSPDTPLRDNWGPWTAARAMLPRCLTNLRVGALLFLALASNSSACASRSQGVASRRPVTSRRIWLCTCIIIRDKRVRMRLIQQGGISRVLQSMFLISLGLPRCNAIITMNHSLSSIHSLERFSPHLYMLLLLLR